MNSKKRNHTPEGHDRRSSDRTADDADWEAKVLGRVSRRVAEISDPSGDGEAPDLGWEQKSVELLRDRIKRRRDEIQASGAT